MFDFFKKTPVVHNNNPALAKPSDFFTGVRTVTGSLDQKKVDVINSIVEQASDEKWPIGWVAYGLATAWHEARFVPQNEWGKGRGRRYGRPGKYYGQAPYGRGLVQLTWDYNYEWADKVCGLNGALLKNFDLANDPVIASEILIKGMQSGAFTGASLGRFINGEGDIHDFANARRVINGLDKAVKIAGYALKFQDALRAGGYSPEKG